MAKLNQIIAVEKGVKTKAHQDLTAAHHGLQKAALLAGISRTYQPKDEEGEQLPPESTLVQVKAEDVLRQTAATLTRLFDVTATKDSANCSARADVKVDSRVPVSEVPVAYLLFWRSSDRPQHLRPQAAGAGRGRGAGAGPVHELLEDRASFYARAPGRCPATT
ncbi:hypothetical protein SCALM49S_00476 [Streptomyces californicus]